MAEPRRKDVWLLVLYGLLLIASLALLAMGVVRYFTREGDVILLGAGVLSVIVTAAMFPIAVALFDRQSGGPVGAENANELLRLIGDRLMISESAKRIAFRAQDREALRHAIEDEISKRDYEAALALVEEMSSTYGYRMSAEQFRKEIEDARAADMNQKISELIAQLDKLVEAREWEKAFREAAAINRMYPDSPRTGELPGKVRESFEQYKQQLEREFLEAAKRDDIDAATSLLKELDKFLTEKEAEPLRETARGVITKMRDNLGVQFKLAVHDHEWTSAVSAGEQIIREFPNTRMAQEVRDIIDVLRSRAADEQAAKKPAARTANA